MKSMKLLPLLMLFMLTFAINAYSAHPPAPVAGTVSERGCNAIGGSIVTDWIDAQHNEQVELCKYQNEYFRIVYPAGCEDEVFKVKDPKTGKIINEMPRCDVPSTWYICSLGEEYGNVRDYCLSRLGQESILEFEVDNKDFRVSIYFSDPNVAVIGMQGFYKEMKSIVFVATASRSTNINITLPNELLGGPYSLSMKKGPCVVQEEGCGQIYKGEWNVSQNATHASFFRDLPASVTTIEITGTTVLPEFPIALIILATSIAGLIIVGRFRLVK